MSEYPFPPQGYEPRYRGNLQSERFDLLQSIHLNPFTSADAGVEFPEKNVRVIGVIDDPTEALRFHEKMTKDGYYGWENYVRISRFDCDYKSKKTYREYKAGTVIFWVEKKDTMVVNLRKMEFFQDLIRLYMWGVSVGEKG